MHTYPRKRPTPSPTSGQLDLCQNARAPIPLSWRRPATGRRGVVGAPLECAPTPKYHPFADLCPHSVTSFVVRQRRPANARRGGDSHGMAPNRAARRPRARPQGPPRPRPQGVRGGWWLWYTYSAHHMERHLRMARCAARINAWRHSSFLGNGNRRDETLERVGRSTPIAPFAGLPANPWMSQRALGGMPQTPHPCGPKIGSVVSRHATCDKTTVVDVRVICVWRGGLRPHRPYRCVQIGSFGTAPTQAVSAKW